MEPKNLGWKLFLRLPRFLFSFLEIDLQKVSIKTRIPTKKNKWK
jgi:hypothetical protein